MPQIKNKADLEQHKRLKKMEEDARMHTAALMNLFNVMGTDNQNAAIKGMYTAMQSEHRFIQQEFMSSLQRALTLYSGIGTDARNIAGVTWAKEAGELVPNVPFMS
jgi:hypothetical protein